MNPIDWQRSFGGACISADNPDVVTIQGIFCLIGRLIQPLPAIIVLAALGMVIFAGIRMIQAGADPKAYAAAWQTFTYAIIGLILLSAAWLLLVLIERFTGAPVTKFEIPPTPTP